MHRVLKPVTISCGIVLDFVFRSAPRSHTVQPRPVDIHADPRADPTLHVPGNRVPLRHSNLLERTAGVYRTANRPYT